ncbi:hypothetical protein C8Q80DRAFT_316831 [Daedaleopsis nitida]|nr:hypothetical protein C8Q80DRAFT_316831 [Daedaleopsis nitida]
MDSPMAKTYLVISAAGPSPLSHVQVSRETGGQTTRVVEKWLSCADHQAENRGEDFVRRSTVRPLLSLWHLTPFSRWIKFSRNPQHADIPHRRVRSEQLLPGGMTSLHSLLRLPLHKRGFAASYPRGLSCSLRSALIFVAPTCIGARRAVNHSRPPAQCGYHISHPGRHAPPPSNAHSNLTCSRHMAIDGRDILSGRARSPSSPGITRGLIVKALHPKNAKAYLFVRSLEEGPMMIDELASQAKAAPQRQRASPHIIRVHSPPCATTHLELGVDMNRIATPAIPVRQR